VGTAAPPSGSWYHCNDPEGYYPYVTSCNQAWTPVATNPSVDVASAQ
jgi:hypothetical protein